MKRTKKWKKLLTLTGVAYFSLAALFSPACTLTADAKVPETATTYADSIQWRFKVENGKLYRRLYNYTKCVWIGDWEYVRDV